MSTANYSLTFVRNGVTNKWQWPTASFGRLLDAAELIRRRWGVEVTIEHPRPEAGVSRLAQAVDAEDFEEPTIRELRLFEPGE